MHHVIHTSSPSLTSLVAAEITRLPNWIDYINSFLRAQASQMQRIKSTEGPLSRRIRFSLIPRVPGCLSKATTRVYAISRSLDSNRRKQSTPTIGNCFAFFNDSVDQKHYMHVLHDVEDMEGWSPVFSKVSSLVLARGTRSWFQEWVASGRRTGQANLPRSSTNSVNEWGPQ